MRPFQTHTGIVAPFDRANVDTDLIIPKQFLKSVKRTGFGPHLFDQLRYLDEGQPGMDCTKRLVNKDFFLNQPRYQNASILLTRENFGCGSSREHAPWALLDFGFKVILSPSFADIFYNNCFKNGILPIILAQEHINTIFQEVEAHPGYKSEVDLTHQKIALQSGKIYFFKIDSYRKRCLLEGVDDIDLTLKKAHLIKAYEQNRRELCPWLFEDFDEMSD